MVLRSNGKFNDHGDHAAFRQWIFKEVDALSLLANGKDVCAIKSKLKEIVPEYTPDKSDVGVV